MNLEKMDTEKLEKLQVEIAAELMFRKSDKLPEHDFRNYIKYAYQYKGLHIKKVIWG